MAVEVRNGKLSQAWGKKEEASISRTRAHRGCERPEFQVMGGESQLGQVTIHVQLGTSQQNSWETGHMMKTHDFQN